MVVGKKCSKVGKMILVWYLIFSVIFILVATVNQIKWTVYNIWVQDWVENAIGGIMSKAEDKECKAFTLFSGNAEVGLVNVKCLQQAPVQNQEIETTPETVAQ